MSYEAWGDNDDNDGSAFDPAIDAGWLDPVDLSKALIDVMNERDRQVNEEGFTPAWDDGYTRGELARAAAVYALSTCPANAFGDNEGDALDLPYCISLAWPFDESWLKAEDARRSLVKAAACLLADIERLDRAEGR
jgi:hypothetical protein